MRKINRIINKKIFIMIKSRFKTAKGLLLYQLLLLLLIFLPIWVKDPYLLHLLIIAMIWSVAASNWDLLVGYMGMFNFAQAAFLGIGAYSSALISMHLGVTPWLSLLLGGLITGTFSIVIGLPVLRLAGAYVAMVTLAFSEAIRITISNWTGFTRGVMGLWGIPPLFGGSGKIPYYYSALALLILSTLILVIWTRSRYGIASIAIKESKSSSESLGINITGFKLAAFFVSSSLTGIAGGFYAFYVLLLSPVLLDLHHMFDIMAMGIIGGIGTIFGPIIGAFIIIFSLEYLRAVGEYRFLIYGVLLILIMLLKPQGLYAGVIELLKALKLYKGGKPIWTKKLQ